MLLTTYGRQKDTPPGDLLGSITRDSGSFAGKSELQSWAGMPIPRSSEMRTGSHGRRLWSQTTGLAPTMTVTIYFGELIFATATAIVLLAISAFMPSITAILFCCGLAAWTLAEYITHRFVLHGVAPVQHGIHHARPQDGIDKIFWQIWLAFAVVYLIAGGAFLAGVLVAYAWYLHVHHCAHHNSALLPASLLKHHRDHHRFARRNYGVTTKCWDRVFGTMLR
jgi:sterol desaturase/sphingolipid hydroxylase (fatty acid hydroxylase superfamily)